MRNRYLLMFCLRFGQCAPSVSCTPFLMAAERRRSVFSRSGVGDRGILVFGGFCATFGQRLRAYRVASKLTQTELARRIGGIYPHWKFGSRQRRRRANHVKEHTASIDCGLAAATGCRDQCRDRCDAVALCSTTPYVRAPLKRSSYWRRPGPSWARRTATGTGHVWSGLSIIYRGDKGRGCAEAIPRDRSGPSYRGKSQVRRPAGGLVRRCFPAPREEPPRMFVAVASLSSSTAADWLMSTIGILRYQRSCRHLGWQHRSRC